MKAVILAGGKGTRLQPITFSIPKPLVPLGNKTLIEILISHLKKHGFNDILLSIGYLSDLIQAYCKDGSQWGVQIDYCKEDQPLGTAGPLSLLRDQLKDVPFFLLMNGDVITDLDVSQLAEFHEKGGHALSVAYVEHKTTSPFGVLNVEGDQLKGLEEKPSRVEKISAGIYAISSKCLEWIPNDKFFSIPDLIEVLWEKEESVGAFPIEGFWRGFESADNHAEVMEFLNSGPK